MGPRAVPGDPRRIAILHAGGLAPGMNSAARDAVRLGIRRGHTMLGVRDGFVGLREGAIGEPRLRGDDDLRVQRQRCATATA